MGQWDGIPWGAGMEGATRCQGIWTVTRSRVALNFVPVVTAAGLGPPRGIPGVTSTEWSQQPTLGTPGLPILLPPEHTGTSLTNSTGPGVGERRGPRAWRPHQGRGRLGGSGQGLSWGIGAREGRGWGRSLVPGWGCHCSRMPGIWVGVDRSRGCQCSPVPGDSVPGRGDQCSTDRGMGSQGLSAAQSRGIRCWAGDSVQTVPGGWGSRSRGFAAVPAPRCRAVAAPGPPRAGPAGRLRSHAFGAGSGA